MPNYCENFLSIEGNADTLKEIMDFVKSDKSVFDFEKIVPMPDYIYRGAVGAKEKEIYGENNCTIGLIRIGEQNGTAWMLRIGMMKSSF